MNKQDLSGILKHVIDQMYASRYFTNHGPLAKQFEKKIAEKTGFNNAVAINNFEISLLIALNAQDSINEVYCDGDNNLLTNILELSGISNEVLRSIDDFKLIADSAVEKHQSILYCALDQPNVVLHDTLVTSNYTLIERAKLTEFHYKELTEEYIAVVNLKEEFGLDYDFEGAVLLCDCDSMAEKFRNMRSSYGINKTVSVKATCNGRFSEHQAGLYLQLL